jgi:Ca-activated chloride channel homolog
VDEVVELSVRYGIVTPYTSFLVDETEDALSSAGRESIAQQVYEAAPRAGAANDNRAAAPTAPQSGEAAVEKSVAQDALREAEVASQPESEQVRVVGAKTFVLRSGVWTDTTFDASEMTPEQVPFGSQRYYALLRNHPDWGRYLALGQQVIVVDGGVAYEVVPGTEVVTPATHEPAAVPSTTPTPDEGQSFWEWLHNLLSGLW